VSFFEDHEPISSHRLLKQTNSYLGLKPRLYIWGWLKWSVHYLWWSGLIFILTLKDYESTLEYQINVQHILYFFQNFQETKIFLSLYLWILRSFPLPLDRNIMSLVFIIIFYPQILLRCVINNFRSPKFHKFGDFFQPARLFHPVYLLHTLE